LTPPERPSKATADYSLPDTVRVIARLLLSALFLFSAWLKAIDYPAFEVHLLTQAGIGWEAAPLLATLLIATEFTLGFYWLNPVSVQRWFEHATTALLWLFNGYLAYQWWMYGNGVDCGCMGSSLRLNPSEALSRNLVALAMVVLSGSQQPLIPVTMPKWAGIAIPLGLAVALTAVTTPPPWEQTPAAITTPINDSVLLRWTYPYAETGTMVRESVKKNAVRAPRLTAVLSVHCPYCALAADRIVRLRSHLPAVDLHLILIGKPYELPAFVERHKLGTAALYHPPVALVLPFAPRGLPETWLTHPNGRQWSLSLRQIHPQTLQTLGPYEWLRCADNAD